MLLKEEMDGPGDNSLVEYIFFILAIAVFGNLLRLAIRMAWGITKLVCSFLILPIILIALVFGGLLYLAFPILVIVGLVSLFKKA